MLEGRPDPLPPPPLPPYSYSDGGKSSLGGHIIGSANSNPLPPSPTPQPGPTLNSTQLCVKSAK
jgi:hypothetical protein